MNEVFILILMKNNNNMNKTNIPKIIANLINVCVNNYMLKILHTHINHMINNFELNLIQS